MTRDIIEINEALCDGCGDCVVGCSEGAIKIIDGKAKLVREDFCDGFGDCMAVCHSGALKVIKRDAPAFDDEATRAHLLATQGPEAVRKYEEAQRRHEGGAGHDHTHAGGAPQHAGGGCPGSAARELKHEIHIPVLQQQGQPVAVPSELGQWPVQLHLVQPGAPFFRNREMLVMSTCGPIASADVHQRYLRGRSVVVACPKLDNTAPYAQKLGAIFQEASIPKVIVVIMEVPCCRGLSMIVQQAFAMSGRDDLIIEEHTLALDGDIKNIRRIA
ncbi:MAG: 4Fe-4S ferredoxin [Bacteroidota bacterium]